jgi:hypothetical protein
MIPSNIAPLLVAYFGHTATEQQQAQLDEWVCANDENMHVFENCLEASLKPKSVDPDRIKEDMFSYHPSDN